MSVTSPEPAADAKRRCVYAAAALVAACGWDPHTVTQGLVNTRWMLKTTPTVTQCLHQVPTPTTTTTAQKGNLIRATMPAVRRAPATQIPYPGISILIRALCVRVVSPTNPITPFDSCSYLWDIMRHGSCVPCAAQRPCLAHQNTQTRGTVHDKVFDAASWLVIRVQPTILSCVRSSRCLMRTAGARGHPEDDAPDGY